MMANLHLLVVDDSPTVRKLVELTFRSTPWRIDYASTGGEALLFARQAPPDVILLDFVLPDMRGTDVCERLAKDALTAGIPIIIMSAKENASDTCRNIASVYSCLAKPSTSEKIRSEVEAAASSRKPAKAARNGTPASFAQKEAAAKALYGVLRDTFANIPQWNRELGDKPPSTFFARKILTPQVTGDLVDAMIPHFREILRKSEPPETPQKPPVSSDSSFSARVRGWPLVAILTFFESSARTGALTLRCDGKETIAYLQRGEIVAVTNHEPVEYLRGLRWANRKSLAPEAMKAAAVEQQKSGTPVPVTLAAGGHFPTSDLTEALATQGRRLLMAAMGAGEATFEWRDMDVLPAYVEAHGRHISTARNTLPFGPESDGDGPAMPACQRTLEQLRKSPVQRLPEGAAVFMRPRGFSEHVRKFSLMAAERQVLTLVDGRTSAEQLGASSGLETSEVLTVLARLAEVRLVCQASPRKRDDGAGNSKRRLVMIMESDREGFQRPLADMLQSRSEPIVLMDLAGEKDLLAAVRRERPQQVLLNAAALPIKDTLRAVRSDPEVASVSLVAVLEPDMAERVAEFSAAGFDQVLVKPIARADIERLFP